MKSRFEKLFGIILSVVLICSLSTPAPAAAYPFETSARTSLFGRDIEMSFGVVSYHKQVSSIRVEMVLQCRPYYSNTGSFSPLWLDERKYYYSGSSQTLTGNEIYQASGIGKYRTKNMIKVIYEDGASDQIVIYSNEVMYPNVKI